MIDSERKAVLFRKIQKLEAYHEIQNEAGRLVAAFNFRQADRVLDHFALDQDDVSIEYADEGVFKGKKAVTALIQETVGKPVQPGEMLDMQLTTPMIEVADDVQTAKALWWMPGCGAVPQKDSDPEAIWAWGELGMDLIRTEDQWKVWHLHYFRLIKCDYKKGWVEDISMINRLNVPMNPLAEPCTYHNPYSPLSIRDGLPACPRPYEHYEDSDHGWMLNRDKTI